MHADDLPHLVRMGMKDAGIDFVAWVPDSWTAGIGEFLRTDKSFKFVQVTNEGEGLALCAGAWLGGRKPALIMENTGFLVASHALETASIKYGIPTLLLISNRGQFGDATWWLSPLGGKFSKLLRAMNVRYIVVRGRSNIKRCIRDAWSMSQVTHLPCAVLLSKKVVKR